MSEFNDADKNGDGAIDESEFNAYREELQLEALRREIDDADAKRDTQRLLTILAASGMLLYPFSVIATEYLGLNKASDLLATMSNIYYVSAAAIIGAYFGFSSMGGKK